MYIYFFKLLIYGFKIVDAIIGHNVRPVEENEFPSVVCISRYDPNESWQDNMQCTGTLISPNFILTAAHCFANANNTKLEISVKAHQVEMGEKYYPVWWICYDEWGTMNIPNFVVPQLINDILLAKIFGVWRDVPLSGMGPIDPPNLMYGLDVTIVGCGKLHNDSFPEVMHAATVKVIDLQLCNEIVSSLQGRNITIGAEYSCSVGTPYTQVAYGDSGGPLMYFGLIIGINIAVCPRLDDEFHPSKVNIHVNLQKYQNFLNQLTVPDRQYVH